MAIKISGSTIIDDSRNIVAGAAATFTGNVSVGGTLTYEDVTNIDSVGIITAREGIKIPFDNKKIQLGSSAQLEIYHDNTHSYIKEFGSGGLYINGSQVTIGNTDNSKTSILATPNSDVVLKYNNLTKLATTNTGVSVTGTLAATALTGDGSGLTGITTAGGSPTAWSQDAQGNLKAGSEAGENLDADTCWNILLGQRSGYSINSGDSNILIGCCAGTSITAGCYNVILGHASGRCLSSAGNNVIIGKEAGTGSSGNDNVFLGRYSGTGVGGQGDFNIGIGYATGGSGGMNNGDYNIALGFRGGYKVTTGDRNISMGYDAGKCVTTGSDNIAIGQLALGVLL